MRKWVPASARTTEEGSEDHEGRRWVPASARTREGVAAQDDQRKSSSGGGILRCAESL